MGGRVHRRTRRTTESKAEVYLCAYSPISHRLTGCTWPQPHRSQVDAFYLTTVHLIEGQGYVRVMKEVSCIRGGDCPPASYVTECDKMRTNTWSVRLGTNVCTSHNRSIPPQPTPQPKKATTYKHAMIRCG